MSAQATVASLWSNELQLGRRQAKPRCGKQGSGALSLWTGASAPARRAAPYPGRGSLADVRGRLQGLVEKRPQVMVKITGGGKTLGALKRHMDYIGRSGEGDPVELEDQEGYRFKGAEAVEDKLWQWINEGPKMEDASARKQAFNIIFSMPEGTDHHAVRGAVRATALAEFAGHQWVMAQHFDEPHPHLHVHVKAEAGDGVRLNPRKADLLRWRERFAHELRERGVAAEATKRAQRLDRALVDKPWQVSLLEEADKPTRPRPPVDPEAAARWTTTEREVADLYLRMLETLRGGTVDDRRLASQVSSALSGKSQVFRDASRRAGERTQDLSR